MHLKKISKIVAIFSVLIVWGIKLWARPRFSGHENIEFFLGIAPNLIGSFCIVFFVYWFFENYFFLFQSLADVQFLIVLFFILLVANEFLQLFPVFGRTFDWNDILFSAVGLEISYLVFVNLYKKQIRNIPSAQLL